MLRGRWKSCLRLHSGGWSHWQCYYRAQLTETEPRRQLSRQLSVMYYYYHHHHNRGIQDQINQGTIISPSVRTIKSIRIQLNSHEEQGLDNNTETVGGRTGGLRMWKMFQWLKFSVCEAVRSRPCWIFPWRGGQRVRARYHYDPYPGYLERNKIIISTHSHHWTLHTTPLTYSPPNKPSLE